MLESNETPTLLTKQLCILKRQHVGLANSANLWQNTITEVGGDGVEGAV